MFGMTLEKFVTLYNVVARKVSVVENVVKMVYLRDEGVTVSFGEWPILITFV